MMLFQVMGKNFKDSKNRFLFGRVKAVNWKQATHCFGAPSEQERL